MSEEAHSYEHHKEEKYAADFSRMFRLQLFFHDSRQRAPTGMSRDTARKLKRGDIESWRAFRASLNTKLAQRQVTEAVNKAFGFDLDQPISAAAA